ncbi:MAG: 2OG-Fe(II) oxygenase [Hyphomicrobiaceae bacterium]|nr:2OG-Fe(II) oxygenase [Hyphomicrobiaceae bacterium]
MDMLATTIIVTLIALSAGFAALRVNRLKLYRTLESQTSNWAPEVGRVEPLVPRDQSLPSFSQRLARLDVALPQDSFDTVQREIEGLVNTERSYLPTHKKGGTVAYETLVQRAPHTVALYRSPDMAGLVSAIVGETVTPTPLHDQSSCSVLFYERPGDHIGWHYDHNFYRGRHFTVLIPILNRGHGPDGLSAAKLEARFGERIEPIATPPNTLVVFEGQKVLHRVTPIEAGERRIMLSMTFATDARASRWQGFKRRIKDTAFFGPRALWT